MDRSRLSYAASALFVFLVLVAGYRFVPKTTSATPEAASEVLVLRGMIRDFRASHPDFAEIADDGLGHIAGFAAERLDSASKPVYQPQGRRVTAQRRDAQGRAIMTSGLPDAGTSECITVLDQPGSLGPEARGSVTSGASFEQWFRTTLGVNSAGVFALPLVEDEHGMLSYESADFTPIDNEHLGNGPAAHNRYFTFEFKGTFRFEPCAGQVFGFEGDDDAWLFVNGVKVMDLGGVGSSAAQWVEFDRLGLEPDTEHTIHFFYAHRGSPRAPFRLWTNVKIATTAETASN